MKEMIPFAAALALLGLGCFEDVPPPPPEHPEPTAPANVLENVELAFNNRDVDLLKAMLSAEFVFYFDPKDVGERAPGRGYIIPEYWSYTEFWNAANNMFTEAYSISLTIPTDQVGTPGENETTYTAEKISISLLVMADELSGYLADNGYCNFDFESYTSKKGKKQWRLTNWWDHTAVPADCRTGVSPPSLGKVLAVYY
jgi:hypothetical protein